MMMFYHSPSAELVFLGVYDVLTVSGEGASMDWEDGTVPNGESGAI